MPFLRLVQPPGRLGIRVGYFMLGCGLTTPISSIETPTYSQTSSWEYIIHSFSLFDRPIAPLLLPQQVLCDLVQRLLRRFLSSPSQKNMNNIMTNRLSADIQRLTSVIYCTQCSNRLETHIDIYHIQLCIHWTSNTVIVYVYRLETHLAYSLATFQSAISTLGNLIVPDQDRNLPHLCTPLAQPPLDPSQLSTPPISQSHT